MLEVAGGTINIHPDIRVTKAPKWRAKLVGTE